MSPKHLLLDFGGVCLVSPFELHRRVEQKLELQRGSLSWMGPLDPQTDSLWQRLSAKEITEREYWSHRAVEVGKQANRGDGWTTNEYMTLAYEDEPEEAIIRPGARDLLKEAKAAGRRVGVLTNDLYDFHGPEWVERIDFFKKLDALTDASRIPALKPDPRAYQAALDDLGVEKEDVVFVDDQARNVEGARQFGLTTIFFDIAKPEAGWLETRRCLGLPA